MVGICRLPGGRASFGDFKCKPWFAFARRSAFRVVLEAENFPPAGVSMTVSARDDQACEPVIIPVSWVHHREAAAIGLDHPS